MLSCAQEKRYRDRLWCEAGAFLLGLLPPHAQAPALGLAVAVVSIVVLAFAWHLFWPVVTSTDQGSD